MESTDAAIIYTMEPVLGALWAYLFLGERWGPDGWIGAALILFSSFATQVAFPPCLSSKICVSDLWNKGQEDRSLIESFGDLLANFLFFILGVLSSLFSLVGLVGSLMHELKRMPSLIAQLYLNCRYMEVANPNPTVFPRRPNRSTPKVCSRCSFLNHW